MTGFQTLPIRNEQRKSKIYITKLKIKQITKRKNKLTTL